MVFILNSEQLDLSRNVYSKHKGWDLNKTVDLIYQMYTVNTKVGT